MGIDSHSSSLQLIVLILLSRFLYLETITLALSYGDLNARCIETEKNALLKFKDGLVDPSGRLSSWVGDNCCDWRGVGCNNRTGHVIELQLRNPFPEDSLYGDGTDYELGGEINPSLLDLKILSYLDLSMNNFGGTQIPDFIGSLANLQYLNLSGASFAGPIPQSLKNLSSLLYLDLKSYSGESSESDLNWLSNLQSLKYLNLESVDLHKTADNWLQTVNMVPSLLELHLSQCQLSQLPLSLPFVNLTSLLVLDLSNNGFDAPIPNWLFNLTTLQTLDLNSNNLQGGLSDEFSSLISLQQLDLSQNSYIGGKLSKSLGSLCDLKILKLSVNKITGELSDFIDGLVGCNKSSLETLDLGYNMFAGNLPYSIGYLANLRYLLLWHNSFGGSIPNTIGNLSSLEELHLSDNQMSGNITESLGQLSSLAVLELSENPWEGVITEAHFANLSSLTDLSLTKSSPNISLVFNISSDWVPPFKLGYINIRSCQLGPKFPTWLRNQNELSTLVLNNAMISDTIPDWFWKLNLQLNELNLAYNQLSGKIPNSLGFLYKSTVGLSSNRFEGPLPLWSSNVSALYLRDNLFSGPIPPEIGHEMPLITDLDISRNFLKGNIPMSFGNFKDLTNLAISNNGLSGEIPDIWNNTPDLYFLDMSNNSISGVLPKSLGSLTFLRFLLLYRNNLSGELPLALKNCTNMDSLDLGDNLLSGEVPSWIGDSLPSLLILRLRNNSFSGTIPLEICTLSTLHILDLSKNKLSGFIPPCMGNLSGFKTEFTSEDAERYEGRLQVIAKGRILQYTETTLYLVNSLDLSSNDLSGEIPEVLTDLFKLGTLNLSMNSLTGKIPVKIGSLEWLETLDLSKNKLSGHIPPSMGSLTFLSHLNLSYNSLSGEIPTSNQFQTLNDPSIYEGNLALCGLPLSTPCTDNDETDDKFPGGHEDDEGDGDYLQKLWFYITIGAGFFVGFWGVCGSLIIKKQWRDIYFDFLERMKDGMLKMSQQTLVLLQRKVFGA